MGREVHRALQPLLFQVERNENDRSPGFRLLEREPLGHFKQHRHAAGVVVGARKQHVALGAQVIEMSGEDDPLVAQLRIAAGQYCRDIASDRFGFTLGIADEPRDRLKIGTAKRRLEPELLERRRDVFSGAHRAGTAPPREFRRRQSVNMRDQLGLADRLGKFGLGRKPRLLDRERQRQADRWEHGGIVPAPLHCGKGALRLPVRPLD